MLADVSVIKMLILGLALVVSSRAKKRETSLIAAV